MCDACSKFPIKTSTSLNLIISLSDGKDAVSSILYSDIFQVFYTFFSHYYYHTTMVRWQFILTFVFNTGANKISFTLLSITHSARARKLKYTPTNSTIIEIKTQLVKIAGLSKTPFLQNTSGKLLRSNEIQCFVSSFGNQLSRQDISPLVRGNYLGFCYAVGAHLIYVVALQHQMTRRQQLIQKKLNFCIKTN